MSANLYEQTKELGILRAMGLRAGHIIALYTYEAFVLVLASSLLGILVGILVAFTMVIQFSSFLNMPVMVYFPWKQLLIIIGVGICCSLLSTIGPTRKILKNKIANILKAG